MAKYRTAEHTLDFDIHYNRRQYAYKNVDVEAGLSQENGQSIAPCSPSTILWRIISNRALRNRDDRHE
jgi:hypothetical protein